MRKALVVGINDYPKAPLCGCINDADKFSSIIERNGDGSPNFDIRLKNDVKTKSELKGLISELFSGDSDTALFYFSGHGDNAIKMLSPIRLVMLLFFWIFVL